MFDEKKQDINENNVDKQPKNFFEKDENLSESEKNIDEKKLKDLNKINFLNKSEKDKKTKYQSKKALIEIEKNISEVLNLINSVLLKGKWKLSNDEMVLFLPPLTRLLNKYASDYLLNFGDETAVLTFVIFYITSRVTKKEKVEKAEIDLKSDKK